MPLDVESGPHSFEDSDNERPRRSGASSDVPHANGYGRIPHWEGEGWGNRSAELCGAVGRDEVERPVLETRTRLPGRPASWIPYPVRKAASKVVDRIRYGLGLGKAR